MKTKYEVSDAAIRRIAARTKNQKDWTLRPYEVMLESMREENVYKPRSELPKLLRKMMNRSDNLPGLTNFAILVGADAADFAAEMHTRIHDYLDSFNMLGTSWAVKKWEDGVK